MQYVRGLYLVRTENLYPACKRYMYKPPLPFSRKIKFTCAFAMIHYKMNFNQGFYVGNIQSIDVHDYIVSSLNSKVIKAMRS